MNKRTPFNWRCPFCDHNAVITDALRSVDRHEFYHRNKYGGLVLITEVIVCPNRDCQHFALEASLHQVLMTPGVAPSDKQPAMSAWKLIPASNVKVFPDYVPAAILTDYREACLIRSLSTKASATLSRRCLQGMIRDFWGVKKARLMDEIEAIKEKVDPLTWAAIDAVRQIGNIGAHMEKDINLIIDVHPEEAGLLIGLIETLIHDWYIVKHEREQRMSQIIASSGEKAQVKRRGVQPPAIPDESAKGDS